MLNTLPNYDFPIEEEIISLFPSEEEAIYALYEQLFDSLNAICPFTILNSMKYLIWKKGMKIQINEITKMTEEDVCVIHHREAEKERKNSTQEIKNKLYNFLEEEIT